MFESVAESLRYVAEKDIAMVDLKITGVAGQWIHVTIPASGFTQKHFEEGVGYDGSSGAGFGSVESGDVAAVPVPESAFLDPFWDQPTLSFLCDTVAADTKEPFPNDPRTIARRAVAHMRRLGIADEAWMGPEFEFHVFDRVDVTNEPYDTTVRILSNEVHTGGEVPSIARKSGYMRVPPVDQLHDLRSAISITLGEMGIPVRYHHHEVGAPGQCEIEIDLDTLVRVADRTMIIKYVIKNLARRYGKLATFMPKPVFGEAGNGMHVHQNLSKDGKPLFYDNANGNYADLSDLALHYIGGLLLHGRALAGLTNPSTNSYKRLVEGYEAPVNLFFSLANRSAAIRVPRYAVTAADKRIEYRPPDFTGNIYVALAGMLMAGIDGIERQIDCGAHHFGPFDTDMAKLGGDVAARIVPLPRSLHDALTALDEDRTYLTKGEVFSEAFLDTWIESKRAYESAEIARRPHPHEYALYLDT